MECRVLGVPDELLGEAVVAAVVTAGSTRDAMQAIVERCRVELPSFMQPRRVEIVEALPRTASQKVDDARLRALLESRVRSVADSASPA
jgi:acyl-coenzyme A synthetase/AMP-(fatty) acid ligase